MLDFDSHLTIVGIGSDGWGGLSVSVQQILREAEIVLGSPRQLALLPEQDGQRRVAWPSPLRSNLPGLLDEVRGHRTVVLASGDPLVSGIGATLIDLVGAEHLTIVPHVSSVALARARLGWPSDTVAAVSVVGRDVHAVLREVAPGRRILVLSSDERTPGEVATLLVDRGYGDSRFVVLGDLGNDNESRCDATASTFVGTAPRLNVIALEIRGPLSAGWSPGLPDSLFENDGQLTKRDVRAAALARLMPVPGQLLWDVGAGAGSVGIEWMRADPTCRTIAIEANDERAQRILRNSQSLGVPALRIVNGSAPESLSDLPAPHAIFIGGGVTRPGVLEACLSRLLPGGRLVAHGVTLETELLLAHSFQEHGGELVRLSVESTAPVGSFTGWTPSRTITQWFFTKL